MRDRDRDRSLEAWRFLWAPLQPSGATPAAPSAGPSPSTVGISTTALVTIGIGTAAQASLPEVVGAYRQNAGPRTALGDV